MRSLMSLGLENGSVSDSDRVLINNLWAENNVNGLYNIVATVSTVEALIVEVGPRAGYLNSLIHATQEIVTDIRNVFDFLPEFILEFIDFLTPKVIELKGMRLKLQESLPQMRATRKYAIDALVSMGYSVELDAFGTVRPGTFTIEKYYPMNLSHPDEVPQSRRLRIPIASMGFGELMSFIETLSPKKKVNGLGIVITLTGVISILSSLTFVAIAIWTAIKTQRHEEWMREEFRKQAVPEAAREIVLGKINDFVDEFKPFVKDVKQGANIVLFGIGALLLIGFLRGAKG